MTKKKLLQIHTEAEVMTIFGLNKLVATQPQMKTRKSFIYKGYRDFLFGAE